MLLWRLEGVLEHVVSFPQDSTESWRSVEACGYGVAVVFVVASTGFGNKSGRLFHVGASARLLF